MPPLHRPKTRRHARLSRRQAPRESDTRHVPASSVDGDGQVTAVLTTQESVQASVPPRPTSEPDHQVSVSSFTSRVGEVAAAVDGGICDAGDAAFHVAVNAAVPSASLPATRPVEEPCEGSVVDAAPGIGDSHSGDILPAPMSFTELLEGDFEGTPDAGVPDATTGSATTAQPPKKKSNNKRKRSAKFATRGSGFTEHELKSLLNLLDTHLPIARYEWETVARLHNAAWPGVDCTVESLRKKFTRLYKTNMGTGNPNIPPMVEKAIRIANAITDRADEAQGEDIEGDADSLFQSDDEESKEDSNEHLAPRPLVAPRMRRPENDDSNIVALAQAAMVQEQEQRKYDREQRRMWLEEERERREEERRHREEDREKREIERIRYEREREEDRREREQDRLERAQNREQSLQLLQMIGMGLLAKTKKDEGEKTSDS